MNMKIESKPFNVLIKPAHVPCVGTKTFRFNCSSSKMISSVANSTVVQLKEVKRGRSQAMGGKTVGIPKGDRPSGRGSPVSDFLMLKFRKSPKKTQYPRCVMSVHSR
jgi:hypothetical protein